MANPDHTAQLQKGLEAWNARRVETPNIHAARAYLCQANLSEAKPQRGTSTARIPTTRTSAARRSTVLS
jgi:hypothetical protein